MVWKQECSCTRNGGLVESARTRFSTIVHSTSSSWMMMSFFRILIAYSSSVPLRSASITLPNEPLPRTIRKLKSVARMTSFLDMLCAWSFHQGGCEGGAENATTPGKHPKHLFAPKPEAGLRTWKNLWCCNYAEIQQAKIALRMQHYQITRCTDRYAILSNSVQANLILILRVVQY
uniref:Uncharacterized protein n=1 Tax=Anopheles atroparvus TaxID=41427 RepID=A0A182JI04_ANOAO